MPDRLSILCIHGVGHGDADTHLEPSWTDAITQDLHRWNADLAVDFEFLRYDDFFAHAPLNPVVYADAFAKLLASGVVHGIGDLIPGARGLGDLPDQVRWTAGMIAQWASEDGLRADLRDHVLATLRAKPFDLVCAHSLGSLIAYDTFSRNPRAIANKVFLTFGSQIGNPFVRDSFAGRLEPVNARMWYHLYNSQDHVLTARLRFDAPTFAQIPTDFDKPDDVLNHDPVWYFNHANTQNRVWLDLSGAQPARAMTRQLTATRAVAARPERRALLIGINAYPDAANRLEGCVNDVYLMSSVLQECGFHAEEIRVVLDHRATTANILERFHWLLDDVPDGGERVLFYSGHGAQIPTYDVRGEVDHLDECLVPWDFDWTAGRAIRDKQFVEFYSQLPYDSRFVAIFDCCHSGGMTRDGGLRPRGIEPPDDIRHRALAWDLELGMWRERTLTSPNRSLARSRGGDQYLGAGGATYRLGRGVPLRSLASAKYTRERKALRHRGPYLPTILEACQEKELSYEYRDGATSYGAFTYSLAKVLRELRGTGRNPSFLTLSRLTTARLRKLRYEQTPCLVGPRRVISQPVPWAVPPRGRRTAKRKRS
ncbi:MAG TPA: caspase family protein [Candidatus Bathyarchaeia archaeon]|nr:caspase family protein [Candidatus Bathyarchaeia archaeon]